jgi:hypothetical protein
VAVAPADAALPCEPLAITALRGEGVQRCRATTTAAAVRTRAHHRGS